MQRRTEQYQDMIARLYPSSTIEDKNGRKILSKPITFCVTNACQLRCTYCYEQHKGNQFMKFETAKKFIDLLLSGEKGMSDYISPENSPAVMLEFIGGEPFMAIDLMNQIVDYWMDRTTELMHPWADKFVISICSNGVAYFDPKVQSFLEKHKDHMSFSITIDGNKKLHDACRVFAGTKRGCYDIAMAAAKDWMSKGYYMGSKVTLAPENLQYMYSAIMHMIDNGYTEVLGNCVYEAEWSNQDALLFYEQGKKVADEFLRRNMNFEKDYYCSLFEEGFFKPKDEKDNQNWCGGDGSMIACDWDGEIYPCIRYMEMSLGKDQPKLPIGNVDDGVTVLSEHKKNLACLTCINRRSQSTDECFYCPIAEGCSWCSAWNYQLYGTPNKRCTRICPMHKARALFNYYFWNSYYLKHNINRYMKIHIPEEWALEVISIDEFRMLQKLEKKAKCNASVF